MLPWVRIKALCHLLRQQNTVTHTYNIGVFAFPIDNFIPHKAPNNIGWITQLLCRRRNFAKDK